MPLMLECSLLCLEYSAKVSLNIFSVPLVFHLDLCSTHSQSFQELCLSSLFLFYFIMYEFSIPSNVPSLLEGSSSYSVLKTLRNGGECVVCPRIKASEFCVTILTTQSNPQI